MDWAIVFIQAMVVPDGFSLWSEPLQRYGVELMEIRD
jgi:hypothetical protein